MQIVVSLDPADRWRWQMRGSDGLAMAESCGAFASYSLALRNAHEVLRCIPDAPLEIETSTTPPPLVATDRIDKAFAEVRDVLRRGDLEAALEILNRPTPHRYSAIYWMADAERLLNLAAFDKLNQPYPPSLQSLPYNQSFCQHAVREGQFRTANSALDPRLDGNVYQGVLNSYHAVPLVSEDGRVLGTLSHFNMAAVPLDDDDFELLRRVAPVIAKCLPDPAVMAMRESEPPLTSTGYQNG